MSVRNRFSPVEANGLNTGTDSKVQQQFADQADINNVVKRFKKTGVLQSTIGRPGAALQPIFGAYPHQDYCEMYEHIQQVKEQFLRLPARTRARFDNNPANIVRFVSDPKNLKEAVKLGLAKLPEGYELDKAGNLMEQLDIEKEAQKEPPKADPEANPRK